MEQQMITYKFKSQTKSGHLFITGDRIDVRTLKKQIATKSGSKEEELVLDDQQTGERFKDSDFVKSFSVVIVERVNPLNMYSLVQPSAVVQAPTPSSVLAAQQLLDGLTDRARYFMIKSSNEDNIRIAKEKEIWATTFINQRKLKEAFDEGPNVLLFFRANNSNNLLGLARMEEKPSDTPNKSVWAGVDTIKLGGNFRIKWLSRGLVAASRFQNEINPLTREYVSRSGDVQEIERTLGKKMASLFELSAETDLSSVVRTVPTKPQNFINIDEILNPNGQRTRLQPLGMTPLTFVPPGLRMFPPPPPPFPMMYNPMYQHQQQMMYMNMLNQPQPTVSQSKDKQKEKEKPKKKRQSSASSSPDSESDSDSESSRSSPEKRKERRQRKRKSKKSHHRQRKQRKHSSKGKKKRDRSRSRDRRRNRERKRK